MANAEDFDHDGWVKEMQDKGHMASGPAETPDAREFQEGSVENPVDDSEVVERALSEGEHSGVAPTADERETAASTNTVELKYLGHGAYEANGVEVRRNGQAVEVTEEQAQSLTGLLDEQGNALFERV